MSGLALWSRDCIEPNAVFKSPVHGLKTVEENRVVCARYRYVNIVAFFLIKFFLIKKKLRKSEMCGKIETFIGIHAFQGLNLS